MEVAMAASLGEKRKRRGKRKASQPLEDEDNDLERKQTNHGNCVSEAGNSAAKVGLVSKCFCLTVEKQEREILSLKRKLQERDVYGGEKGEREDGILDRRLEALEEKVDRLLEAAASGRKSGDVVEKKGESFSVQFLHNKVDKCIRMMAEMSENFKKLNSTVRKLSKKDDEREKEAEVEKEILKSTRLSASIPSNIIKVANKTAASSEVASVMKPAAKPSPTVASSSKKDENEEHDWGKNMLLVGDVFWSSFAKVDDVRKTVDKMGEAVGFRIGTVRDNCLISDLFDHRETIKFPLPRRFKKVGLSVGAHDLLSDEKLMTLSDGPLAEVKKFNASVLSKKAHAVRKMIDKLLTMEVNVLLLVPPFGRSRREVFQHWRELISLHTDDLPLPSFRILDFYNLMSSTLPQFKDAREMLDNWMVDQDGLKLSDYGTRKLFDALMKCQWAKNKKSLTNLSYLKETEPGPEHLQCERCSKFHKGGSDSCKSKDRTCRRCGRVGHFDVIHEVIDAQFRKRVTAYLGEDIYATSINHASTQRTQDNFIGPLTENETNDRDPSIVISKLDDWYH